jgi:uncharacterized protein with PIN domain
VRTRKTKTVERAAHSPCFVHHSVCRWLRSIGIDCAHYTDKEKKARGGAVGFFDRAVKERRIIITKSIRLIERRGCPPWFLLRHENLESAFAALILHFGLQFEEDLFYSRCIFCNSGFDAYPAAYFIGGMDEEGKMHEPHEPFMDIPRGFINLGYRSVRADRELARVVLKPLFGRLLMSSSATLCSLVGSETNKARC